MKHSQASNKFDPLLCATLVFIGLGAGGLAWEWHHAHPSAAERNTAPQRSERSLSVASSALKKMPKQP